MELKVIGLSFKNNPEDIELYKWIISHSNKSGFIKDTLRTARRIVLPTEEIKEIEYDNTTDLVDF